MRSGFAFWAQPVDPVPADAPDFIIEVQSSGLTTITCNRPLPRESVKELRDMLGKLSGDYEVGVMR